MAEETVCTRRAALGVEEGAGPAEARAMEPAACRVMFSAAAAELRLTESVFFAALLNTNIFFFFFCVAAIPLIFIVVGSRTFPPNGILCQHGAQTLRSGHQTQRPQV